MSVSLEEHIRARRELPAPSMRRALREAAGVSQGEIARELGVSIAAVGYWESGKRFPRPENLAAYVRILRLLEEGE